MEGTWTAARIKEARKRRGLTQRALGDSMGVSPAAVAKWESGATTPTYYHRKRLEELLGDRVSASSNGDDLAGQVRQLRTDLDALTSVVQSLLLFVRQEYADGVEELPPPRGGDA